MITTCKHLVVLGTALAVSSDVFAKDINLSSLDLTKMRQGWGTPQTDRSIKETPLKIAGQTFAHGVGTHAASTLWIQLDGNTESFKAAVGVDDAAQAPKGRGSIIFQIYGDGRRLYTSGVVKPEMKAKLVDVPLSGVRTLLLKVGAGKDGQEFDHANWGEARFVIHGKPPVTIHPPKEEAVVLTPKPGPDPKINSPKVYGCRPGNPFLYRLPTTGQRPIQFSAEALPGGLQLDAANGIISGTAPPAGKYPVNFKASNSHGTSTKPFTIVSGERIALTPYMGWNHWYAHYTRVSDALVRRAADTLISSGMADAGYDYVNIDDCWMRKPDAPPGELAGTLRDERGNIVPNGHFPDMKGLTDYLHNKGLKAGIYSSPGTLTCCSYAGSYQHEAEDARQIADWGFDLFKYDWCSYGKIAPSPTLEECKRPYLLMGKLVSDQKRDIVFNLCQYGMGDVWKWGAEAHGQSWRTAGDLGFELNRIFEVAVSNAAYRAWQEPGHWNDPDYVQIGYVGEARVGGEAKPSILSPNEQYAFMSLWSLSAVPLVFSGDMDRLDEFTLNVLCNPEVIEIDQDPLGQCASVSAYDDDSFVMVKEMEDGSKAVGLCNAGEMETTITASWSLLAAQGKQRVRDVWRHKDIGIHENEFQAVVPRRAVTLLRLYPAEAKP